MFVQIRSYVTLNIHVMRIAKVVLIAYPKVPYVIAHAQVGIFINNPVSRRRIPRGDDTFVTVSFRILRLELEIPIEYYTELLPA